MTEPLHSPAATELDVERLNEALRGWFATFSELSRRFGTHHGIHSSDAAALIHITSAEDRGAPLTQTQLARRIGLTTPATSSLLNRLEDAGHIQRHRSRADRRVVTLKSTQAMHDQIHEFFREVGDDVQNVALTRSHEAISTTTALVLEMTDAMNRHLNQITDSNPEQTTPGT